MTIAPAIPSPPATDADLVAHSLAGDHQAYGQIVARYQSLICSLVYSASGSLQQSEDLAQETFVTAWRQLNQLREPSKLRPWLCTIARHLAYRKGHQDSHEPSHAAQPLDLLQETPSPGALPDDETISREEAAILWRSLEKIPENYREPLVLFYREHQSIQQVAESLDLSEDNVKQRLFRGRKLLTEEVTAFVEGALARTAPGPAFTQGVLSALPILTISTKTASLGATAAKAGLVAKTLSAGGLFGVIVGPLAGLLGGWIGVKTSLAGARSPRERQFIIRNARLTLVIVAIFLLSFGASIYAAQFLWKTHHTAVIAALVGLPLVYGICILSIALTANRNIRRIRQEDGTLHQSPSRTSYFNAGTPFEYRSSWSFLGLPLIHVCTGPRANGKGSVAKGWIACGDCAIGFLASGGVAVGVIAFGGLSIGLFSLGGAAVGLLVFGGCAVGWWALGGCALGNFAAGGSAVGWHAATGGLAVAHHFAVGGAAVAQHANDPAAHAFIAGSPFFQNADWLLQNAIFLVWLPMGFVFWQAFRMWKHQRSRKISAL